MRDLQTHGCCPVCRDPVEHVRCFTAACPTAARVVVTDDCEGCAVSNDGGTVVLPHPDCPAHGNVARLSEDRGVNDPTSP